MALPPLADVSALVDRLGEDLDTAGLARAEAALADVSALVRAEAGRTWLNDDGTLADVPADIVTITLQAALRAVRNPEGYLSESEGDYTYRRSDEWLGIYLTDAEKAVAHRYRNTSGVWSLGMTRGDGHPDDTVYVPWSAGGDAYPMFSRWELYP